MEEEEEGGGGGTAEDGEGTGNPAPLCVGSPFTRPTLDAPIGRFNAEESFSCDAASGRRVKRAAAWRGVCMLLGKWQLRPSLAAAEGTSCVGTQSRHCCRKNATSSRRPSSSID